MVTILVAAAPGPDAQGRPMTPARPAKGRPGALFGYSPERLT